MGPYTAIKQLGINLPEGGTTSEVCPFCNGGVSSERSFSLTREGFDLLFMCHRAKCGRKGKVFLGTKPSESTHAPAAAPRLYTGEVRQLTEDEAQILWNRYHLGYPDIRRHGLTVDSLNGRLMVPVKDAGGSIRGFEGRRLVREGEAYRGAKTLHFRHKPADVWQGYFFPVKEREHKVVVVVEDTISAMKVSRQFPCVSIMGSHIRQEALADITKALPKHVIKIALDKDATDKALGFIREHKFYYPNLAAIILEKDMKYLDDGEIQQKVLS